MSRVSALAVRWLLILLALLAAGEVVAQTPFDPPELPSGTVTEIHITGNRRVEEGAIRNTIATQIGQPLERRQLRQDILSIRDLGIGGTAFFDDVQVDVSEADGGLVVTYIVREKPVIASLSYEFVEGDELRDDLEEVVDIEEGDVFDLAQARANVNKLEELYREKGYFLAEVDYEWHEREDGDVDLTFVILEYAEVEVQRVNFVGNEALSDEELQSVMATRPGDLLSFLSGSGVFNETEFGNDRHRLRLYYYDNGYVDVEIGEPSVELSRDLGQIYITIPVQEGPQYSVAAVEVAGDMLLPVEEIEELFVRVEVGETYSTSQVRQDIDRISTYYKDQGYANVNVNLGTRRDAENRELGLVYDIQQGQPVYIGRITISGNQTTRDEVIRRELRIHESDLYHGTGIRISQARVQRLGFFETVEINEITTASQEIMNLEVQVVERPTGQFQVGAGFSSVESFIATATISQNNLFGRGQSLSLQASISAIRTIFSLGFSEPYLFGTRWQFGFEIFNRELLFTDFTRRSLGFSLTGGYPITDDITASLTYQLENVEVEAGGRTGRTDRQISNIFQGGLTSSVRGSLSWDTRNNRLFPSYGFLQTASLEVAEDFLGSENEFLRVRGISRWYYELFTGVVLKFNAALGWVATTNSERPVPIFERFFLGGPNSVRGFERATLSPTEPVAADPNDPASSLVGFPVGGNKELLFNLEVEFPIITAIGIRGVLFMDAGNAFGNNQPYTLDLDVFHPNATDYNDVLRTSVGFGFRWFSPIGPLRFEWGFPLSPLDNEEPSVFEFSVGNFL